MNRDSKILFGIATTLLVVGVAGYFFIKKGNTKKLSISDKKKENTSNEYLGVNTYFVGYILNQPKVELGKIVTLVDKPPKDSILEGDMVKITDTTFDGVYKVNKMLIDKNQNITSLYLDIRYEPKSQKDQSFYNKGKIQIL
jgi:hypothetical protein